MENEIAVRSEQYPMTAMAVVAQVRLVQEVMKAVMKKDTHYGVIPGCQKPSLWKPGAEVLLVTFRIATESQVEDLSTQDEARYRVTRKGTAINSGLFVGSAVGECSSNEEKYKWRYAVCQAEYDATPEDRRREKYKRDGSTIKQVRTNHADVANTILKMADKRAYVALALNATAASDCFVQDLEDLPAEIASGLENGGEPPREPINKPQPKAQATPTDGRMDHYISDAQRKRFYAIWKGAHKTADEVKARLTEVIGCEDSALIPASKYEALCTWASLASDAGSAQE